MKKIVLNLPGKTKEELWDNLTALVSYGCQCKRENQGETVEYISISGEGSLKIVDEDKRVESRMEHYEKLMKEAAMYLQNCENSAARDFAFQLRGAIEN